MSKAPVVRGSWGAARVRVPPARERRPVFWRVEAAAREAEAERTRAPSRWREAGCAETPRVRVALGWTLMAPAMEEVLLGTRPNCPELTVRVPLLLKVMTSRRVGPSVEKEPLLVKVPPVATMVILRRCPSGALKAKFPLLVRVRAPKKARLALSRVAVCPAGMVRLVLRVLEEGLSGSEVKVMPPWMARSMPIREELMKVRFPVVVRVPVPVKVTPEKETSWERVVLLLKTTGLAVAVGAAKRRGTAEEKAPVEARVKGFCQVKRAGLAGLRGAVMARAPLTWRGPVKGTSAGRETAPAGPTMRVPEPERVVEEGDEKLAVEERVRVLPAVVWRAPGPERAPRLAVEETRRVVLALRVTGPVRREGPVRVTLVWREAVPVVAGDGEGAGESVDDEGALVVDAGDDAVGGRAGGAEEACGGDDVAAVLESGVVGEGDGGAGGDGAVGGGVEEAIGDGGAVGEGDAGDGAEGHAGGGDSEDEVGGV
jgi:hypothetical protein